MKGWMIPWLFPVVLLATVVSVTVFQSEAGVVLMAAGWLLVAFVGSTLFGARDGEDPDSHYWRINRR